MLTAIDKVAAWPAPLTNDSQVRSREVIVLQAPALRIPAVVRTIRPNESNPLFGVNFDDYLEIMVHFC